MYSIKNKNINIDNFNTNSMGNLFNIDDIDNMDDIDYLLILLLGLLVLYLVYKYFYPNYSNSTQNSTQKLNQEKFSVYGHYDSNYAPLNVSGIDINKNKLLAMNNYPNQISYDLDHPFASDTDGENRVPWDPSSYEEYMEPNGQVVGYIAQN